MKATTAMEAEWGDEFAQCLVVAAMWCDDFRAGCMVVADEFIQGGKPVFVRARNARPSPKEWERLRSLVFERDDYTCTYCGAEHDLVADHVVPLSRGGANHESNLVCACRPCNSSKRDLLQSEWKGRR